MKKIIAFTLALCVILVSLTSVFAQKQEQQSSDGYVIERQQYAYVNTDGVRLRATPSLSGTILATLYTGYILNDPYGYSEVYSDGYWWHYVGYNGTFGWVASIYLDFE